MDGKALSSRNATRHGLYATDAIINSPHLKENPDEYNALVKSLFDELKPEGLLQKHLVIKIANCLWRYRRVINAETAKINRQLENPPIDLQTFLNDVDNNDDEEGDDPKPDLPDLNLLHTRAIPNGSFRLNLMHYEMRLDRQLTRAYRLLRHLQLMDEANRLAKLSSPKKSTQNEPISLQIFDPTTLDPT